MTRIGVIARCDETGLGVQSRNWVRLLDPYKVIVINSTKFNGNKQHPEWYQGRGGILVDGFIKPYEFNAILKDIDVLLTFEIPYNYDLLVHARAQGVKTIIQNNWEFTDYLQNNRLPLPDLLVNHSYWHLDDQKKLWPDITEYCPTPLFLEDFDDIYETNLKRKGKLKFLHVAGRKTYEDRNGTNDLIGAMNLMPKEIELELVIKTQTAEFDDIEDPRVIVDKNPPADEKELYRDFDAMVLPRRYAGASLPMNEALAAGLPVIMTDIDPNNKVLPKNWLVPSEKRTSFMARTEIDVYSADRTDLAARMAQFTLLGDKKLKKYKEQAREIAQKEYSSETVKRKWDLLLSKLKV